MGTRAEPAAPTAPPHPSLLLSQALGAGGCVPIHESRDLFWFWPRCPPTGTRKSHLGVGDAQPHGVGTSWQPHVWMLSLWGWGWPSIPGSIPRRGGGCDPELSWDRTQPG